MAGDKRKFHERFNLDVDIEDERRKFAYRVYASLVSDHRVGASLTPGDLQNLGDVVAVLGIALDSKKQFLNYLQEDFFECLRLLQGMFERRSSDKQSRFGDRIQSFLDAAQVNLGVTWRDGMFLPSGAALLDERLIHDLLHWLADPMYDGVRTPYKKALGHFLEVHRRPELLSDVVTDAYEALEAMAKIICGNNKDLTANRELFISKLDVSDRYKQMLKSYVEYARDFRHAPETGKPKPTPSETEVESYIYMTGIFLRLGAETIRSSH